MNPYLKALVFFFGISLCYFSANATFRANAADINPVGLMERINQERVNRNIQPLATSAKLVSAAAIKTQDMLERDYFDHLDPDGNYAWPIIESSGYYPYEMLGENLAIDFSTETGVINAWIASPSHRDNLLRAEFADQGLSAQYGDFENRYTSVIASFFGRLAAVMPKQEPLPQSVPDTLPESANKPGQETPNQPVLPEPAPGKAKEVEIVLTKSENTISTGSVSHITPPSPADRVIADDNRYFDLSQKIFIALMLITLSSLFLDLLHRRKKTLYPSR